MEGSNAVAGKPKIGKELKTVLTEFSETTSAHGPPKIVGHKYIAAKLFWIILFVTGIAVFGYFSYKLIVTYMKYESTTDVQLKFSTLNFPAVSFCNLNQFRNDRLPKEIKAAIKEYTQERRYDLFGSEDNYDGYFEDNPTKTPLEIPFWETTATVNTASTAGKSQTTTARLSPASSAGASSIKKRSAVKVSTEQRHIFDDLNNFYTKPNSTKFAKLKWFSNVGKENSETKIFLNFTRFLISGSITETELQGYGHDIEEMLQECTFQGKTCGPQNFYQFYDGKYGNCYTFNSGLSGSYAKVNSPGAAFGLSMTLFINQPNYVPVLSPHAGVRLLLHKQGEVPQIAEGGFNVAPGFMSNIAVRYLEIERLEGKVYSNCTSILGRPNDGTLHSYYPGNYTQQGCYKTCIQKVTVERCGCANALYRVPPGYLTCGQWEYGCVTKIEESVDYEKNCSCPLPCWESQYHHTIASSQWPSNTYEPYWKQSLRARGKAVKKVLDDKKRDSIKEEFVNVQIYFDNLNYYFYKERASMTFEDLVGNLGGHLGLWIGMSVISFVEVFELVVSLFGVCTRIAFRKKKAEVYSS